MWIWQTPNWPNYNYDASAFTERIDTFRLKSERLSGCIEALPLHDQTEAVVDLMLSEAITTSSIEGENLDRNSVRSSLLHLMGMESASLHNDEKAAGAASLMVAVRKHWNKPLTHELLGQWQSMILADRPQSNITRGTYRNDPSPMQIASGAIGRYKVHYEAPPAEQVPEEMSRFIDWYNSNTELPGPLRAGIAHVWFENIHPFDDGNGRVGRAIADHALSQSLGHPTLACLSTAIERDRKTYYLELERVGRGNGNINTWLDFFTHAVNKAQDIAKEEVDFILSKARFYEQFGDQLNDRQAKAIHRVFTAGTQGFEGGLTTRKYQSITKCSRATAFRDLAELVDIGAIVQNPGGGRSTHYQLAILKVSVFWMK